MSELTGQLSASGVRVAIAVARFNDVVTSRLLAGALEALAKRGVGESAVTVAHVPGCFELPLVAQKLTVNHDAVICLGALVRGDTPHFEYIAAETTRGIGAVALASGIPVIFGVLTTNTMADAMDRAGGKQGNKGAEAAEAALEMADLHRQLSAETAAKPQPAAAASRFRKQP
jgi:6,7-dimethyl-8-ribityllumazine synthase